MSSEANDEAHQFFSDITSNTVLIDSISLKIGRYTILESELHAEVVNWCLQYLTIRKCPQNLMPTIVKKITDREKEFLTSDSNFVSYDPQRVTQLIINMINEVCVQMVESNWKAEESSISQTIRVPQISECSERNMRRFMEDRHVVIHELNAMYGAPSNEQISFYGVFDGHDGVLASSYTAAHLPFLLSANSNIESDTVNALKDAFHETDKAFVHKCKDQKLKGGTTAVCALYIPNKMKLFISWVGDSQALLAKQGVVRHIVKPHKPDDPKEYQRIQEQGGSVMHWGGQFRVNGIIAISRAIGDCCHKPFIICEPETECIHLDGTEDFLILATDGLWDHLQQENAADLVYTTVKEDKNDAIMVAEKLVKAAKVRGSQDNITVIVIFLQDPSNIAESCQAGLIKIPIPSLAEDNKLEK